MNAEIADCRQNESRMVSLPLASSVTFPSGVNMARGHSSRLLFDPVVFDRDFDRRPFYVDHDLAKHPLLELSSMADLSDRLHPALVEWNDGQPGAYANSETQAQSTRSCREAILSVGEHPTWVLLREIEHDVTYKSLLDELLNQIEPYSKRFRPGMCRRQGFLFISSRAAVTAYHFDPEHNFLLQARGRKTVHMWEPSNRDVIAESALDNYYANFRTNRDQPYKEEYLKWAWVLPLTAGQGIHFPLHAPHWVKTESDISVSLSITFRSRESNWREAVHTSNGYARRVGLHPPAPRATRLWDATAQIIFVFVKTVRLLAAQIRRTRNLCRRVSVRIGF